MKRILSFMLALVLCVGAVPVMAAEQSAPVAMQESIGVSGDSSFGNMLAAEIEDELADQQQNNGYRIFEVTVADTVATVELEAVEDCTLVVGIYTEDGRELLVSGWTEITAGDTKVTVQLETAEMPTYFFLKAFLVDEDKAPLCPAYATPNYTKEMQDFFAATVEDFDSDRVLNLDGDAQNNFAVFKESVKRVDTNGKNILSVNGGNYIFQNADDTVKNLQSGDIITCPYNGDTLILVVATVAVDGDTVTLTEADAELQDVFDYVKIDGNAGLGETSVGEINCPEGVTFDGLQNPNTRNRALDMGESFGKSASFTFHEKKIGAAKLTGSVDFSLTGSIKLYATKNYASLTVKVDYSVAVALTFGAKADLFKIPLGVSFTISPVPGVSLKVAPKFVGEISAKITLNGALKGTLGFAVNSDEGIVNLCTTPTFDGDLKGDVKVFVGISLNPKVEIIHEKLTEGSMDVTLGAEVKAKTSLKDTFDEHHECTDCFDGDIHGKLTVEFKAKLLNNEKWSFKLTLPEISIKIADFYWSMDKNEFGWGTCPYVSYKVEVTVLRANSTKANGAKVVFVGENGSYETTTNSAGVATIYLPNDMYVVTASLGDESGAIPRLEVKNLARETTILMERETDLSDLIRYEIKREVLEFTLSDGTLYYSNTIYYPFFFGNSVVEKQLNNKYATIIDKYKNNTTDFDALYEEILEWSPDGVSGMPFYDDISAEVTYCKNDVISIKERSTMWSGGMHPYSDYIGHTYSISDGRELSLCDIFVGSDTEIKKLIDQHKKGIVDYLSAETILASPFVLTEDGLCFLCNVGDAVPRQEVVIPYTDSDSYIISAGGKSDETPKTETTETSETWDISQWKISRRQAEAYTEVLRNAEAYFETVDVYADQKEVYATLVDVDGNALLWLAAVTISDNEPWMPGDIAFGTGSMSVVFEEIWEWDGSKAVPFEVVSKYEASVNVWPDGLEVFTYYKGTDVDGEAWSAFFPFNNGRMDATPKWCHAWGWVYDYKLKGLPIAGKNHEGVAEIFFDHMMTSGSWPNLPFNWEEIHIVHQISLDEFYAEVTGGKGYNAFLKEQANEEGYYRPENTSNALQCAAYIAKQDGTWETSGYAMDFLSKCAQSPAQKSKNEPVTNTDNIQTNIGTLLPIILAAASGEQTATFEGLTPGGIYNFYVMKDKAATEAFETENLLYIDQGVADANGTLTFRYVAAGGQQVLVGEPTNGVLGDVDGDESITSTDARMTLQFYAGKIDESKLNTAVADVDGDGAITSTDARLILQYYAGKIEDFPI